MFSIKDFLNLMAEISNNLLTLQNVKENQSLAFITFKYLV